MRKVYLDNAATTALSPKVLEKMMPYLTDIYGNASSPHSFGQNARIGVEHAREQVARAINADPSEIVFTGCGKICQEGRPYNHHQCGASRNTA